MHESNRRIRNLTIFLTGEKRLDNVSATLSSTMLNTVADFFFEEGAALSNASLLSASGSTLSPSPLNVFIDQGVDQIFRLKINKKKSSGVNFGGVSDVILGIEYSAKLSS
jgi:hypothetical protein